jgi:hypothetical protein
MNAKDTMKRIEDGDRKAGDQGSQEDEEDGAQREIEYEFNRSPDAGLKRQRTFLCTPRVVKYYWALER